jgi:hypothetical protein
VAPDLAASSADDRVVCKTTDNPADVFQQGFRRLRQAPVEWTMRKSGETRLAKFVTSSERRELSCSAAQAQEMDRRHATYVAACGRCLLFHEQVTRAIRIHIMSPQMQVCRRRWKILWAAETTIRLRNARAILAILPRSLLIAPIARPSISTGYSRAAAVDTWDLCMRNTAGGRRSKTRKRGRHDLSTPTRVGALIK